MNYICSNCETRFARELGKCNRCNEWGTITFSPAETSNSKKSQSKSSTKTSGNWAGSASGSARKLSEVGEDTKSSHRIDTGMGELNRALGGGLVNGSVVLIGGDPGVGKSTLLLQSLSSISHKHKVLYVTGEESLEQVAQRGVRLGLDISKIEALPETNVETIIATAEMMRPTVIVADSIQTMECESSNSPAGSVSQVRESAALLTKYAKQNNCSIFLVGHVTKEGGLAGPRVLEHMVDAVLQFEGDPSSPYRLLRAHKNRYGGVNELGAFEMTEEGLISVDNPSAMFLSEDRVERSGSTIFTLQEGQRTILVEIQALATESDGPAPRRNSVGLDNNRVAMLLGVLSKHAHLSMGGQDIFLNAVGGIRATEPASDLPICLSIVSSMREKPWPSSMACFGEIGLTGEIRPVQHAESRIKEAAKLGFKTIIVPNRNVPKKKIPGINIIGASTFFDVLQALY